MNGNQTSLEWKFWQRWVLFSTLGYGIGGIAGLFAGFSAALFIGQFISQFVSLVAGTVSYNYPTSFEIASITVMIGTVMAVGGAVAGATIGLTLWQAIRVKAPDARQATWMKVHIVGMAISWIMFAWIISTPFRQHYEVFRSPRDSDYFFNGAISFNPEEYMFLAIFVPLVFWGLLSALIQWHTLKGQIQHTPLWFALYILCAGLVTIISLPVSRFLSNSWPVQNHPDEYAPLGDIIELIIALMILCPLTGLLFGIITGSVLIWLLGQSNQQDSLSEHVLAK